MGFGNWFNGLTLSKKCGVVIASGFAVCLSGYGLYRACEYVQRIWLSKEEEGEEEETRKAAKRVLLLGLDGSGKSAFLAALSQYGNVQREETRPTEGFNVVSLTTDGTEINIWEVGGAEKFRHFWHNFTASTDVLVYTVDASDANRLQESKEALDKVLADSNLKDVPLVLIVTKQDLPGARSAEEVAEVFKVETSLSPNRLVGVVGVQITDKDEQDEGFLHAKEMILALCNNIM